MMKFITEFLSNLQSPRSKYEVKRGFMCRTNSVVNTLQSRPGSALISDGDSCSAGLLQSSVYPSQAAQWQYKGAKEFCQVYNMKEVKVSPLVQLGGKKYS